MLDRDIEDTRQPKDGEDAEKLWEQVQDALSKDLYKFVQDEMTALHGKANFWNRQAAASGRALSRALEENRINTTRAEAAEDRLSEIKIATTFFAAQLQAWGYDKAAEEVMTEILSGEVVAPDYYAMKKRAEAAEAKLAELRERTRWIPVSERLPERITPDSDLSGLVYVWPELKHKRASFYDYALGKWACASEVKVTHWQPLPEPPEAD